MKRTRTSGPRISTVRRRLAVEILEDRRMLAAQYGFEINLYEDAGGLPGDQIADDIVQVGQSFFVEITAEDLRSEPLGLGSMGMDILWDPQVLREIDESFDPTDPDTSLVTSAFPLWRYGILDNDAGWIHRLRGGAFLSTETGGPIGADGPERFALLHFEAIDTVVDSLLRIRSSGSVGFIPMRPYQPDDLQFERQLITVTDAVVPLTDYDAATTLLAAAPVAEAAPILVSEPPAASPEAPPPQPATSPPAAEQPPASLPVDKSTSGSLGCACQPLAPATDSTVTRAFQPASEPTVSVIVYGPLPADSPIQFNTLIVNVFVNVPEGSPFAVPMTDAEALADTVTAALETPVDAAPDDAPVTTRETSERPATKPSLFLHDDDLGVCIPLDVWRRIEDVIETIAQGL